MRREQTSAEPNGRSGMPEGAEAVRLADVTTFLEVYYKADTASVEKRVNFSALLSDDAAKKGLTTRISQLSRIVDFLYGDNESKRTGLHKLFQKDALGGLVPSADARNLHKYFLSLRDVYRTIKEQIDNDRRADPWLILRVGTPQTIGMRLLSSVFSDRERVLPARTRLHVEIANSHALIRRLKSRLLDVVIAYGPEGEPVDPDTGLMFRSLGYSSRMVLLCHPSVQLRTWGHETVGRRYTNNKKYWEKFFQDKTRHERPDYKDLWPIELKWLDFQDMPLIVVNSWKQPQMLHDFVLTLPVDRLLQVPSYEEALALVRMGVGVAPAPEVFSRRALVTAYKLRPENEFERWIGAYFHPPEKLLPNHVRGLIDSVQDYLTFCGDDIRKGDSPAFQDPKYEEFCQRIVPRLRSHESKA
jgi:DNA-binding transcriptional LysR family regulator